MYLVFTRMLCEIYPWGSRSSLLGSCDVIRVLVNSLCLFIVPPPNQPFLLLLLACYLQLWYRLYRWCIYLFMKLYLNFLLLFSVVIVVAFKKKFKSFYDCCKCVCSYTVTHFLCNSQLFHVPCLCIGSDMLGLGWLSLAVFYRIVSRFLARLFSRLYWA